MKLRVDRRYDYQKKLEEMARFKDEARIIDTYFTLPLTSRSDLMRYGRMFFLTREVIKKGKESPGFH